MKLETMNAIYSIKSSPVSNEVILDPVWTQSGETGLAQGYTSLLPIRTKEGLVLFAYNRTSQKTDTFRLLNSAPWIQKKESSVDLSKGPWDNLGTFVLGNITYLMTYRRETGAFGFFQLANDLSSVSEPYIFQLSRVTSTKGFTTVAPFTSLGRQYFIGYDFDSGMVGAFALSVRVSSPANVPPLHAENIWYHQWSNGWTHFAFFQLGGANFFFKINTERLKINIDHIHDDPSSGANPVGTKFSDQLPDAFSLNAVAKIPWTSEEPYLLTYIASSGSSAIYRIHADCRSLTKVADSITQKNSTRVIPYRIANDAFALFYQG
jgi:hypothetical protein